MINRFKMSLLSRVENFPFENKKRITCYGWPLESWRVLPWSCWSNFSFNTRLNSGMRKLGAEICKPKSPRQGLVAVYVNHNSRCPFSTFSITLNSLLRPKDGMLDVCGHQLIPRTSKKFTSYPSKCLTGRQPRSEILS